MRTLWLKKSINFLDNSCRNKHEVESDVSLDDEESEEIPVKKAQKKKIKPGAQKQSQNSNQSPKKNKSADKKKSPKKSGKGQIKKSAKKEEKKSQDKGEKKKKVKRIAIDEDEEENVEGFDESQLINPGQKFPTPADGDGTRIFYETLLQQKPGSKMAEKWCLEYGVLPFDKAKEIYDKIQKQEKNKKK